MDSIVSFLQDVTGIVISFVSDFLPLSPVQNYIAYVSQMPYLGYINWFCPIGTCVTIMEAWLACIGLWYMYSALLRWVKAAE